MSTELELQPYAGLRIRWNEEAQRRLASGEDPQGRLWEIDGEIDSSFSTVRVLSAVLGDGSSLGMVALRPAKSDNHGDEVVRAALKSGERLTHFGETLVSVEYDGSGIPRRIGLELYGEEPVPLRAAGDAVDTASAENDGLRRDSAALRFRLDGARGIGLLEVFQTR